MGFFSSDNYSAEQVKKMVRPTLNIAENIVTQFENIEIAISKIKFEMVLLQSEYAAINQLEEILSGIYLYYGVSTQQAGEMVALLDNKKISWPSMEAVNKSFTLYATEFVNYEKYICSVLLELGYSHNEAVDYHKRAWENAVRKKPDEMAKLQVLRKNTMHWDWINSKSWVLSDAWLLNWIIGDK